MDTAFSGRTREDEVLARLTGNHRVSPIEDLETEFAREIDPNSTNDRYDAELEAGLEALSDFQYSLDDLIENDV
ncbi:hypothetical protein [Microvirga tunisiensis]|uniref:Uncharacterized protein n=1 Tax=Microvirga tunisiensis TaxID=2108360 RepID=A0A5N7MAB1_9HYPH|nr:hypothetical protein [Microvirga tunisiensis]MPR05642.1 hypothetical protein [Microvirga tunisiensis]MPR23842.1 hypothetical protein [Microvirga tunisiensis]